MAVMHPRERLDTNNARTTTQHEPGAVEREIMRECADIFRTLAQLDTRDRESRQYARECGLLALDS